MRKILFTFFLLYYLNTFAGAYLKVIYIADHSAECGTKTCLLTRESPSDEYQLFDNTIEGFTYEPGYEYCILVEIKSIEKQDTQPLPVGAKSRYILSEIKSKNKIANGKTDSLSQSKVSIPDSSKWMLYKLRMKDGSTKTFSLQKAYLQFDIKNNTVTGNTECNSINGSFTADESSMKFDNIISTKMACGKHSIEPVFLNMLQNATGYSLTSKLLYLYKGKTLIGLFTRKK